MRGFRLCLFKIIFLGVLKYCRVHVVFKDHLCLIVTGPQDVVDSAPPQ